MAPRPRSAGFRRATGCAAPPTRRRRSCRAAAGARPGHIAPRRRTTACRRRAGQMRSAGRLRNQGLGAAGKLRPGRQAVDRRALEDRDELASSRAVRARRSATGALRGARCRKHRRRCRRPLRTCGTARAPSGSPPKSAQQGSSARHRLRWPISVFSRSTFLRAGCQNQLGARGFKKVIEGRGKRPKAGHRLRLRCRPACRCR